MSNPTGEALNAHENSIEERLRTELQAAQEKITALIDALQEIVELPSQHTNWTHGMQHTAREALKKVQS